MKVNRFEELMVWQKAKVLGIEVYRTFENSKDFGFKDQIQRASLSIINNIAEGFERKGNKEFAHFLFIAKGSSGEVRSMLILANELNKIDTKEFEQLFLLSEEISKMLAGLIKTILSRKFRKWKGLSLFTLYFSLFTKNYPFCQSFHSYGYRKVCIYNPVIHRNQIDFNYLFVPFVPLW